MKTLKKSYQTETILNLLAIQDDLEKALDLNTKMLHSHIALTFWESRESKNLICWKINRVTGEKYQIKRSAWLKEKEDWNKLYNELTGTNATLRNALEKLMISQKENQELLISCMKLKQNNLKLQRGKLNLQQKLESSKKINAILLANKKNLEANKKDLEANNRELEANNKMLLESFSKLSKLREEKMQIDGMLTAALNSGQYEIISRLEEFKADIEFEIELIKSELKSRFNL